MTRGTQGRVDINRLLALWAKGLSDRQIATRLAVTSSAVSSTRRKLGLRPNSEPFGALPAQ